MKSNEKSNSLRSDGNEFYKERKFFDALLKYNESLCYAEDGSESAGHAYANRSAIYLEMKLFDECLKNIQNAFSHNYPEKNFEILKNREEKCRKMMKNSTNKKSSKSEEVLEFCKLSHEPNEKISSIAGCLELKCDKKFGRHIITNRSLAVGDVIAIDDPYCGILRKEFLYQRCSNCFKLEYLNLIPCKGCAEVMFCSSECLNTAAKNFHDLECPVMHLITSLTDNIQIALRTFFKGLSIFKSSLEDFEKFFANLSPKTIFDLPSGEILKLSAICSLDGNDQISINDEIFSFIFSSDENLAKIWKSKGDFVKKFLRSQISIATRNFHEISEWPVNKIKKGSNQTLAYQRSSAPYGTASYPFASLLNNSCAPNVHKVFINGKIFFIVQRPIKAGNQVFDNYGFSFTNMEKRFRQIQLLEQYCFVCDCEACDENFSLLPSLKIVDKICLKSAKKFGQELSNLNKKRAKFRIRDLSDLIQKYHANFPSLELCSLIENFQACFEIYLKPDIIFE